MTTETPKSRPRARSLRAALDRIGARPVSIVVFAVSMVALVVLHVATRADVTVAAVAWAPPVDHPAMVQSHVVEAHVEPGQLVHVGDPLVTLSDDALRRTLTEVDAEIRRTIQEGRVEQARLAERHEEMSRETRLRLTEAMRDARVARAQAQRQQTLAETAQASAERTQELATQRFVSPETDWQAQADLTRNQAGANEADEMVRAEIGRLRTLREALSGDGAGSGLAQATAQLYESELEVLRLRRQAIEEDLDRLTVRATSDGVVASVLERGAAVAPGSSVARLVPQQATEVVAYLPPETNPIAVEGNQRVLIAQAAGNSCAGLLQQRRGAEVVTAPDQLSGFARMSVQGLPVHIALPEECPLGVGQVVEVTFEAP